MNKICSKTLSRNGHRLYRPWSRLTSRTAFPDRRAHLAGRIGSVNRRRTRPADWYGLLAKPIHWDTRPPPEARPSPQANTSYTLCTTHYPARASAHPTRPPQIGWGSVYGEVVKCSCMWSVWVGTHTFESVAAGNCKRRCGHTLHTMLFHPAHSAGIPRNSRDEVHQSLAVHLTVGLAHLPGPRRSPLAKGRQGETAPP